MSDISIGLAYDQPFLYCDTYGTIRKEPIGEFVNNHLVNENDILEINSRKINHFYTLSFNPVLWNIETKELISVSRSISDSFLEISVDDYSRIKITEESSIFILKNCALKKVKAKNVKVDDVLLLSNSILKPRKPVHFLNLYNFNEGKLVNLKKILEQYSSRLPEIKELLNEQFGENSGYKINEILKGTKNRGLSKYYLEEILKLLNLKLEDAWMDVNFVSKKSIDSIPPLIPLTDDFLTFAGLYIAEGYCRKTSILMSNSNAELQQACKRFFDSLSLHYYRLNKNDVLYYSAILTNFFKTHGTTACKKHIPDFYYNLSENQLMHFLRAIFDGDGYVDNNQVCYLSASERLVFNLKDLLLRFNITSRIRTKKLKYKQVNGSEVERKFYVLSISGKDNLTKFYKSISFQLEYKRKALSKQIKPVGNTNVALIQNSASFFKDLRLKNNLTQKNLAKILNCSAAHVSLIEKGARSPSKNLFAKYLKLTNDVRLNNLLGFNFRKVVNIRKVIKRNQFAFMLKIKESNNFAAGMGNIFIATE